MPIGVYKRKPKRDRKAYDKKRNNEEYKALKADPIYPLYLEQKRLAMALRRKSTKTEAMAIKLFSAFYEDEYSFENATDAAKIKFRKLAEKALDRTK